MRVCEGLKMSALYFRYQYSNSNVPPASSKFQRLLSVFDLCRQNICTFLAHRTAPSSFFVDHDACLIATILIVRPPFR